MNDVIAGAICGFIMGLVFIGAGAIMLPTFRQSYEAWLRWLPKGFPLSLIGTLLVVILLPLWAVTGVFIALVYRWSATTFPGQGLGSQNLIFTLGVSLSMFILTVLLFLTQRKGIWERFLMNLAFAVVFGWLFPLLAR